MSSIPNWEAISLPGADAQQIDAAAVFPVGTEAVFRDETTGGVATFVYCLSASTFVAGYGAYIVPTTWTATLLADSVVGYVGFTYAALTSGKYGWFQITGMAYGIAKAGIVSGAQISSSAEAGKLDDDGSGHTFANQIYALEAATSDGDVVKVFLNRPTIGVT